MTIKSLVLSLLAVLLLMGQVNGASKKTLVFTAIPDQNSAHLEMRFSKIRDYLSKKLGVEVKFVPVKDYAATVTAFKNNEVQLGWFGGLSGVKARRAIPGSQAIAQGQEDMGFVTYFIAHKSSGLKYSDEFPKGIQGKTFTFGSKGSTSGRLMPEYYIRQNLGKEPRRVFRKVGFSGSHSKTVDLVQSGAYQVGAVNYAVWEREVKAGNIDTDKVTLIWKTPTYPDYNWTIRGDVELQFGKGFIKKVQQALIELSDKEILASFPRTSFIVADNSMYDPIVNTGKKIGIFEE